MRAARRWLPWLCAYSGARVNELTSLYPDDISPGPKKIWCMVIKPSLEKTAQWRVVPIHSHVIDQGFRAYVEERRKLNKPLFYDPDRSRGGKPGNPRGNREVPPLQDRGPRQAAGSAQAAPAHQCRGRLSERSKGSPQGGASNKGCGYRIAHQWLADGERRRPTLFSSSR
jgi:hypothetical protein